MQSCSETAERTPIPVAPSTRTWRRRRPLHTSTFRNHGSKSFHDLISKVARIGNPLSVDEDSSVRIGPHRSKERLYFREQQHAFAGVLEQVIAIYDAILGGREILDVASDRNCHKSDSWERSSLASQARVLKENAFSLGNGILKENAKVQEI